jgi:hypothetical protein
MLCSLTQYISGDQIEKNEMGVACSTYGDENRCKLGFGRKTWRRETSLIIHMITENKLVIKTSHIPFITLGLLYLCYVFLFYLSVLFVMTFLSQTIPMNFFNLCTVHFRYVYTISQQMSLYSAVTLAALHRRCIYCHPDKEQILTWQCN